ncbi:rhodanese-like domain-containing protein [Sulfurimonas sp. HSL-1716]|uniref:rhodanese-like domain-containing protein n=1 Tax=Hydrocurvibacter sulfurireducens TaxID=3131937 RepID=UPI0031FA347D
MKIFILLLLLAATSLFAEVIKIYPDQSFLKKDIPIVDIRTKGEWKETGILKNAIPITFFDEKGNYNIPVFLKKLSEKVDVKKPFALVCRTGSRTNLVSKFLSNELKYHVYDLKGGMMYAIGEKLPVVPYKK